MKSTIKIKLNGQSLQTYHTHIPIVAKTNEIVDLMKAKLDGFGDSGSVSYSRLMNDYFSKSKLPLIYFNYKKQWDGKVQLMVRVPRAKYEHTFNNIESIFKDKSGTHLDELTCVIMAKVFSRYFDSTKKSLRRKQPIPVA